MSKNIWDKFDREIDENFQKDIENADNQEFVEVPHNDYEVKIHTLELRISKSSGSPMVTIWFKVLTGEYKGNLIFMNQVINTPFQISICNKILKSLAPNIEVKFETYSQYAELLMDIFEEIDGNYEYALKYGENKGFNTFKILDIFEIK